MFKIKKLAAVAVAAVMAVSAMAVSVSAASTGSASISTSDLINNELINNDISARASTSVSFNCTQGSVSNVGRFTATQNNVTFTLYPCTVGAAVIKIHTGSYSGPVVHSFTLPAQGASTPTITSSFSATVGTSYYITAEVYGGYIQSSGTFYITY